MSTALMVLSRVAKTVGVALYKATKVAVKITFKVLKLTTKMIGKLWRYSKDKYNSLKTEVENARPSNIHTNNKSIIAFGENIKKQEK